MKIIKSHTHWRMIPEMNITQRFSPRSDSSGAPHIRFWPWGLGGGVQALEEESPEYQTFENVAGLSPQAVEQGLHSWGAHTRFHMHWDPGQSSNSRGVWARPTCRSWESWGRQLCSLVGTRTPVGSPTRALPEVSDTETRPQPTAISMATDGSL